MKATSIFNHIRNLSDKKVVPKVCVVGAGPAGFYTTQQLIKMSSDVKVDILERLPVPFGLVRFGVAPDHPEVKNVINTFHKTATNPRVQFFGNINVGKNITIKQLKENYHAILLTYGAEEDKLLGIPGENLANVVSGRQFVGWYNGMPGNENLEINLDVEEAVILGQGNVAMDIARILLTPVDQLKNTDITSYALEKLSQSKLRKVWMAGRRGPLQAAFTIAELRELIKLEKCKTFWRANDFHGVSEVVPNLARPRKRLTELMLKSVEEMSTDNKPFEKELHPIFLRGPIEFLGTEKVEKVKFCINELHGADLLKQTATPTERFEEIPCGVALRSIGYKSIPIDSKIPFDLKAGKVINTSGKVDDNLYAAGWVATGPVGVILSTMTNAFQVGNLVSKDMTITEAKAGAEGILDIFNKQNIQVVSYKDWEKIDKEECKRGSKVGKPREKIVSVSEMLEIASK